MDPGVKVACVLAGVLYVAVATQLTFKPAQPGIDIIAISAKINSDFFMVGFQLVELV